MLVKKRIPKHGSYESSKYICLTKNTIKISTQPLCEIDTECQAKDVILTFRNMYHPDKNVYKLNVEVDDYNVTIAVSKTQVQ